MNAKTTVLAFAALTMSGATVLLASCSSDDNVEPTVTPPTADASSGGTSGTSGGGATDAGTVADGGCTSDAATCNSCVAPSADPYNACSSAAGNCIPFDNARVPKGPNGGVPQVP